MKVDEYGVITDSEIIGKLDNLALEFMEIVKDCSPIEKKICQSVFLSSTGFFIASDSVKKRLRDLNV